MHPHRAVELACVFIGRCGYREMNVASLGDTLRKERTAPMICPLRRPVNSFLLCSKNFTLNTVISDCIKKSSNRLFSLQVLLLSAKALPSEIGHRVGLPEKALQPQVYPSMQHFHIYLNLHEDLRKNNLEV